MSDYTPKSRNKLPIIFDDRMPVNNLIPKIVNRVNDNTEDLSNLFLENDQLAEGVAGKVDAPETAGSAGQVLTSDGEGGTAWTTVGSGEIVVDPTLSIQGAAADAKATGDEITHVKQDINELETTKADASGTSENLTAGNAEQLLTDKGITEKVPYILRASGGNGADREEDKIVGGTVAWNQLERFNRTTETVAGVTGQNSNGVATLNGTATGNGMFFPSNTGTSSEAIVGHKYIGFSNIVNPSTNRLCVAIYIDGANVLMRGTSNVIYNHASGSGKIQIGYRFASGATFNNEQIKGGLTDLTAMFGTAIADRAYALEQATAGSGINWLKSMGFFTESYYPYDAGTLKSVEGLTAHVMRDSEDNIIASYPLDSTLTLRGIPKLDSNNQVYYDGDEYASDGTVTRRYGIVDLGTVTWARYNFSGTYAFYVAIDGRKSQSEKLICAKYPQVISSPGDLPDKSINATANGAYIYIRDDSYADAAAFKSAMSGVYLVYELATPTTEEAEPYQNPQILDPYGTEAYETTGIVPVGHETFYPENLRSKIEGLPFNFATLIAPTESTYKATRAYSANNLFIVDNILYKATTSIASGGTITPGTNCTATTLAEIIAALS